MQDSFNLSRFVEAQRRVFSRVMDELRELDGAPVDEQPTQVPPEDMAAECAAIVRLWDAVF